jgi:hypothetical protein
MLIGLLKREDGTQVLVLGMTATDCKELIDTKELVYKQKYEPPLDALKVDVAIVLAPTHEHVVKLLKARGATLNRVQQESIAEDERERDERRRARDSG